jgi:NADPH2:quinone reductase
MRRVVVDRYGGPEVLRVVEDTEPEPGFGEVRVRVLCAGVSITDAQLRAGSYLGVPPPPFTPGYELVGIVDRVGPGCTALREGDRVAALTVWGAYAERVCLREADAVRAREDLDPAQVVGLVLTYMTAYQLLHRMAKVAVGESVLVHGAAGRVGTALLELGALDALRFIGTASARDRAAVERLGAVPIDYEHEDFVARVRDLTQDGVDVALDGVGGRLSIRSFRTLRRGGRLVVFGHSSALTGGRKSWRGWAEWYAATGAVAAWGLADPHRSVSAYRIQKLREGSQIVPIGRGSNAPLVGGGPRHPDWYREDFAELLELLRADKIHPVVAERLPLEDAAKAHEMLAHTAAVGKLVLVP